MLTARCLQLFAPHSLHVSIDLPTSKSVENRALIISALSQGGSIVEESGRCDDVEVLYRALTHLHREMLDVGAAGTAMRFLTAFLAITPGKRLLTGSERMKQRPIGLLVDALRVLGAQIEYVEQDGFPPLRIEGRSLKGGRVMLPGNVSSQFASALLLIAPRLNNGIHLTLTGEILSRPYIDLTLALMNRAGADAQWISENEISVSKGNYRGDAVKMEKDWSAASYWYQLVALASGKNQVELKALSLDSLQGDKRVVEYFSRLGVETVAYSQGLVLRKKKCEVEYMCEDLSSHPDLAQTLAVTCVVLNIPFRFTGLQNLQIKETNRLVALQTELRKIGAVVEIVGEETLQWNGTHCPPDSRPLISTYDDHRMAMAFAPASFSFPGLCIESPSVVSKSYPLYWADLERAGFQLLELV